MKDQVFSYSFPIGMNRVISWLNKNAPSGHSMKDWLQISDLSRLSIKDFRLSMGRSLYLAIKFFHNCETRNNISNFFLELDFITRFSENNPSVLLNEDKNFLLFYNKKRTLVQEILRLGDTTLPVSEEINLVTLNNINSYRANSFFLRNSYFFDKTEQFVDWASKAKSCDILTINSGDNFMLIYALEDNNNDIKIYFYNPDNNKTISYSQNSLDLDELKHNFTFKVGGMCYQHNLYYCHHISIFRTAPPIVVETAKLENNLYNQALILAIRDNNLSYFKETLKNIPNDHNYKDVLVEAFITGNISIIELIPDKEKYLVANSKDLPSLHWALDEKKIEIAKILIKSGVDVKAKDANGETLLHKALSLGDSEIIESLIKQGADINEKNNSGATPLHHALYLKKADTAKILISNGADVKAKNNIGDTILYSALLLGDLDIIGFLVKRGADINAKNNDNGLINPLKWALLFKKTKIARFLIERGADVKAENMLHCALISDDLEIIESLIKQGANINAKNDRGDTVLHSALYWKETKIAKFLIERGADVTAENMLHCALISDDLEIIKSLIKKGAKVNGKDELGRTPLNIALDGGNDEIIKLLYEAGARTTSLKIFLWKFKLILSETISKLSELREFVLRKIKNLFNKNQDQKSNLEQNENIIPPSPTNLTPNLGKGEREGNERD